MVRAVALLTSVVVAEGTVIGYWDKTWAPGAAPQGATLGVAFNGWADPQSALDDSAAVRSSLVGTKYISIGGGNDNGAFSLARVQDLESKIKAGAFSDWQGIALDVEECHETGLSDAFARVTAAAKAKGLETMVTVSHSQPYGCADAEALMRGFFADPNVDYHSPQLYTSGEEASPDFTAVGTSWEQYASAKGRLVPSLVDGSHYAAASDFFSGKGSALAGYVQWKAGDAGVLV